MTITLAGAHQEIIFGGMEVERVLTITLAPLQFTAGSKLKILQVFLVP